MNSKRTSTARAVMLAIMLTVAASAQTHPEPVAVQLCEVFSSPAEYNHKVVSVEGVLSPSIHSLFLSSPACDAEEDADFTTQAVLPASWETLPHGKELLKFLHRGEECQRETDRHVRSRATALWPRRG